jgi:signal peptidase II
MKPKLIILFFTSFVIILLDQWTKQLVITQMKFAQSIPIIDSFFALTYIRNRGAAFGILHSAPSYFRDPFFIVVPVVALVAIGFIFAKLKENEKLMAVSLSLIVGGAIGNLIDRVRFGYVIDFLDFHWKEVYHWPAFNVADSAIVVGVSIFFVQSFFQGEATMVSKS